MPTTTSAPTASITPASSHLVGPLTTTYTPSGSDCSQIFWAQNPINHWLAFGGIGTGSTTCMPSGFNRETAYYYSPGICPTGYSAACSSFSTDSSATKTVATCCPTGYTCFANRPSDQIYGCTSYFTEDATLSINSVLFDTVTAASTTSYPVIYASTKITVTSGINNVAAYGIIIERASDDPTWESSTTSSSTSSSTASPIASGSITLVSATSSSSSTSSAQQSTSTPSTPSSTGLSTGAKAGVGVGVALGVLLISAFAFLFFRRLQKRPQMSQPLPIAGNEAPTEYYEKYNDGRRYNDPSYISEAPSTTLYQQGGELHGNDMSYELLGSSTAVK
ncbi:6186bbd2-40c5-4b47-8e9f-8eb3339936ba [Sclerotinia trifoliorum]|uniref:6186bbd2-40c5-4b47-8e9f-8eb3339936ba n=1 Tax=Sclerotinia trifoliorum TaxID=28548 RepID=A0A8H2W4M1_9HELO|nr:6186bbd2-40c5-4b47-8e9f-8eb3339936ba [Sclerotinia trifoliorum]